LIEHQKQSYRPQTFNGSVFIIFCVFHTVIINIYIYIYIYSVEYPVNIWYITQSYKHTHDVLWYTKVRYTISAKFTIILLFWVQVATALRFISFIIQILVWRIYTKPHFCIVTTGSIPCWLSGELTVRISCNQQEYFLG